MMIAAPLYDDRIKQTVVTEGGISFAIVLKHGMT